MFGHLGKLREAPIPSQQALFGKKVGYRAHPIDTNNALYNEECQDIRTLGLSGENYYFKTDNPPYYQRIPGSISDLLLRTSVIQKLVRVNQQLREVGLELYFTDCYRPLEVQNYFHDVWFPDQIKQKHPTWSAPQVLEETEKYWAKGSTSAKDIDRASPPPHTTGAAFDVLIRKLKNGEQLFFGSLTEDVTNIASPDFYEHEAAQRELCFSEEEAMKNRRLLYWLMSAEFTCNPTEWWHYSWGDQMWAKLNGMPAALYANAEIGMHSFKS